MLPFCIFLTLIPHLNLEEKPLAESLVEKSPFFLVNKTFSSPEIYPFADVLV